MEPWLNSNGLIDKDESKATSLSKRAGVRLLELCTTDSQARAGGDPQEMRTKEEQGAVLMDERFEANVHDWIGCTELGHDRTGDGCCALHCNLGACVLSSPRASVRWFELRVRASSNLKWWTTGSHRLQTRLSRRSSTCCAYGHGDPERARRRLESRLKSRIEQIDRACKLTQDQRSKLNVAGRGDIKRAFARAEELMAKYASVRPGWIGERRFAREHRRVSPGDDGARLFRRGFVVCEDSAEDL